MDRNYKFRLYPSKAQETKMNTHRWIAKNLWNTLLAHCKDTYEKTGRFPTKSQLQSMTKDSGLYSQTSQNISHKINNAMLRYFKLRKKGGRVGFPRFKSIDRLKSVYYPQSGFKLDNKLKVSPFGEISIVKHREINGKIKTLTLKRESSGKWFAVFCVEQEAEIPRENNGERIGIDLGLKTFGTLSNGDKIRNPRHLKRYEDRLATYQKRLAKMKKGSKNRWKQKNKIAVLHEKITNTRADFLHKTSNKLVNDYSLIALEKLASQEMSEQNYGKYINDAGWGMFANMISYKAESAGCKIVFVNPRDTTKTCHICGNKRDMPLNKRIYECEYCGMVEDRDLNASKNILIRATEGHSGGKACGELQ
jgi:putative transposase